VGERYNQRLLTPRDWHSHFKNVLHRALMVRGHQNEACRCCGIARENLQHFPDCQIVGKFFSTFAVMVGVDWKNFDMREKERFALFALTKYEVIEEGWINLHLLLWKQTIAALVKVDTEDHVFRPHEVWAAAWTRMKNKILTKHESVQMRLRLSAEREQR
jgi:hypothetical protein